MSFLILRRLKHLGQQWRTVPGATTSETRELAESQRLERSRGPNDPYEYTIVEIVPE